MRSPLDIPELVDEGGQNTFVKKGQKLWIALDTMYAKDPAGYKNFIEKLKKDAALPLKRVAEPAFAVRCIAVQAPAEGDSSVSVVMSEARMGRDEKGKLYHVYDAVLQASVVERCRKETAFRGEVIDMCLGCVEELFNVSLKRGKYTVKDDEYMGPYGWDEQGKPIKGNAPPPLPTQPSDMTPEALLSELKTSSAKDESGEVDPNIKLNVGQNSGPKVDPGKSLIQEIGKPQRNPPETEGDTPPAAESSNVLTSGGIEPKHVIKTEGDQLVIDIELPDITSPDEIECQTTKSILEVSAGPYHLRLRLSAYVNVDPDSGTASFLKRKGILRLRYKSIQ
ncbi:PIH1 domain-containing protein 2 [Borealophlyctis nickersoniae]|nr:PIH1 domain-containing protein 2 [Borealophlyctis nickersoniae]